MYRIIITLLVLLVPSVADAQFYWYSPYQLGYRNWSMPTYYNYYVYTQPRPRTPPLSAQQLYDRRIKNDNAKLAYEQHIVDNAIARREFEINKAERYASMSAKEEMLRQRGYLPPRKNPKFVYKGYDYGTFDNFKQSPAFQGYLAEIEASRPNESLIKQHQIAKHYEFMTIRNRSLEREQMARSYINVTDSLKADIASGKRSTEETKRLLVLLDKLQ